MIQELVPLEDAIQILGGQYCNLSEEGEQMMEGRGGVPPLQKHLGFAQPRTFDRQLQKVCILAEL